MPFAKGFVRNPVRTVSVSADEAGQRIDNFLVTMLKSLPRSRIYSLLRSGQVRVNKGRVKPDYRLQAGDELRLPPTYEVPPNDMTPPPRQIDVLRTRILFESKNLVVVNKPSGFAVHGGSGVNFGVIELLRHLYPQEKHLELVHRLDRETSGCLLVAKKRSVLLALHEKFRKGEVDKHYQALVLGKLRRAKTVDVPLTRQVLQSGERMVRASAIPGNAKASVTRFEIVERFAGSTLLSARPETGRTHQIRVHAAHLGHPIAGDEKYGDPGFNEVMHELGLQRLFLHAFRIEVKIPQEPQALLFTAPLDDDLAAVLTRLKGSA